LCLESQELKCDRTHTVEENDTCISVANEHHIGLKVLYHNNPQLNSKCTNLIIGEVRVCRVTSALGAFTFYRSCVSPRSGLCPQARMVYPRPLRYIGHRCRRRFRGATRLYPHSTRWYITPLKHFPSWPAFYRCSGTSGLVFSTFRDNIPIWGCLAELSRALYYTFMQFSIVVYTLREIEVVDWWRHPKLGHLLFPLDVACGCTGGNMLVLTVLCPAPGDWEHHKFVSRTAQQLSGVWTYINVTVLNHLVSPRP